MPMTMRCHAESLSGPRLTLSPDEARHAAGSRRLGRGDELIVFDGRGSEARATIIEFDRKGLVVELVGMCQQQQSRLEPQLRLFVGLPKGPRQDVLIEKCAELGVAAVHPLLSRRSVSSASDHKLDRWRRTAIEAAKQSGQLWLPEFHPPAQLPAALAAAKGCDLLIAAVLADDSAVERFDALPEALADARRVAAFVGPEGGWSEDEVDQLLTAGAKLVSLGPATLRIETAAIVLAGIAHWLSHLAVAEDVTGD